MKGVLIFIMSVPYKKAEGAECVYVSEGEREREIKSRKTGREKYRRGWDRWMEN